MPLIDIRSGKTKTVATLYEVTELIGAGRFSEVYKAYDQISRTDVALKIYFGVDEKTRDIAGGEAELLQKLSSLGTDYFPRPRGGLRIFRAENSKHHPFIAMELCEYIDPGSSVRRIVSLKHVISSCADEANSNDQLPGFWDGESLPLFLLGLCDAVRMLHKEDIVHRDIKPSNILVKKIPSERHSKPFFFDFNTSSRQGTLLSLGGTEEYLPPEVISQKRKDPLPADDLWAMSKTIGELVFGKGQQITPTLKPHHFIAFDLPSQFNEVLLRALDPKPEHRYPNANELYTAIANALPKTSIIEPGPDNEKPVSGDEIIWIRERKARIFEDIVEILSGENEIPVFKETRDAVSFIYSSLYQSDTHTFDLKEETSRLGVRAIPALIQESYKLLPDSDEFEVIAESVGDLASNAMDLAKRAIEIYSVSSDYSVRKMCRVVSDRISFFPTNLIDSIIDDDSLYIPEERVDIADLCIKWSNDSNVMLPLNKYMCREYILDQRLYHQLRNMIALRMHELKFQEKAALIVQDTQMRIWEELPEYEALSPTLKETVDNGLKELFADAFSSLGSEALEYMRRKPLPLRCEQKRLPIARVFSMKLAKRHSEAREWLFSKLQKQPEKEYFFAAQKMDNLSKKETGILKSAAKSLGLTQDVEFDIHAKFDKYLEQGRKTDCFALCRMGKGDTIDLIEKVITTERDATKIKRILSLLESYKSQYRSNIVQILIDHWKPFSVTDYDLATHVLTEYPISAEHLKKRAIDLLQGDRRYPARAGAALRGIERLIG